MVTAEYDLGYLETSAGLLKNYLLSEEIYWKMNASSPPGEPPFPSLTLGGVLLSLERANARQISSDQEIRKNRVQNEIERLRMKWRTAWRRKASQEFGARLNLWRNYLEELRQEPEQNIDRYPYEITRRVMLALLEQEAEEIPIAQAQLLAGLDLVLQGLMVPGEFVWDESLAGGFPLQRYPYLFLHLKTI
jgi:hypothetical protein